MEFISMKKIERIVVAFFSPHGNTQKVANQIAFYFSEKLSVPITFDNFTLPQNRKTERHFSENDFVIFASPTYAGKLPNKILPDMKLLFKANATPTLALVTFGNRAFDNSLAELNSVLTENGFIVLGALAFASKHAFAEIGNAHPTANDEQVRIDICDAVLEKLQNDTLSPAQNITGDAAAPYYTPLQLSGEPAKFLKAKPLTDELKCDHCGVCASLCPTGAISRENESDVPGICIKCQSCVTHCHTGAKYFSDEQFLSHRAMLERDYKRLAESKAFV